MSYKATLSGVIGLLFVVALGLIVFGLIFPRLFGFYFIDPKAPCMLPVWPPPYGCSGNTLAHKIGLIAILFGITILIIEAFLLLGRLIFKKFKN
ncbi:hypothetical protein M1437_00100 [Patescibacteria group bacterium]|nr:hypothetical protein [Patescibacteria group bacterium]